jgi:hypothetical protein
VPGDEEVLLTVDIAGADLFGKDGQSQAADLGVIRAAVDLQQEQMALQAVLKSGARIPSLILLDGIP